MIAFFVPGQPVPKQSFRYSSRSGGYTSPRVKCWQELIALHAQPYLDKQIHGRVRVELLFYLTNIYRGDLDNYSKGVLDAIKNILIDDDRYVVQLEIEKKQDKDRPGVAITIIPLT